METFEGMYNHSPNTPQGNGQPTPVAAAAGSAANIQGNRQASFLHNKVVIALSFFMDLFSYHFCVCF